MTDSLSGKTILRGLQAVATEPLSTFTPGIVNTIASTRQLLTRSRSIPMAMPTYLKPAMVLQLPIFYFSRCGGAPQTVIPQGAGLLTPSAVAIDSTGNFFIADTTHGTSPASEPTALSIPNYNTGSRYPNRNLRRWLR